MCVSVDLHLHPSLFLKEINFKAPTHMIVGLVRLKSTGLEIQGRADTAVLGLKFLGQARRDGNVGRVSRWPS